MDPESNDFDDDTTQSMWAHEQELEWQDELTNDPGYFDWLRQVANEVNDHGNNRV